MSSASFNVIQIAIPFTVNLLPELEKLPKMIEGRYRLSEVLDEGNACDVGKYTDLRTNGDVAIKINMPIEEDEMDDFHEDIGNESDQLKVVQNLPYVQKFVSFLPISHGQSALITEYAGRNLAECMREKVISKEELKSIVWQLLAFIKDLQPRNIVHGALVARNVCYRHGKITVIDWADAEIKHLNMNRNMKDVAGIFFELFTGEELSETNAVNFIALTRAKQQDLGEGEVECLNDLFLALHLDISLTPHQALEQLVLLRTWDS